MNKQFWVGLITGVVACGLIGGIAGISMVGKKAVVEPSDLEAYMINRLKNLRIPEAETPGASVEVAEESLLEGGMHYNHHCAVCHDLEGDADSELAKSFYPPVADLTAEHVQAYSDGQLKWIVANGIRFTGMPGWKDILDETTQWNIVRYMRALADREQARRLEALLKERGQWTVDISDAGEHHHSREAAEEPGGEQPEHAHVELEEQGGDVDTAHEETHHH